MTVLEIDVDADVNDSWDDPQRIALRVGDTAFTRLIREERNEPDDFLHAPPIQLAFWLVDNWWRLRWEPVVSERVMPEWRLAHELSAIGGGYAWPRVRIWGEGARVGISSRSDRPGANLPVRYLKDALFFVSADQYEHAIDGFLRRAVDARTVDHEALRVQFEALQIERKDEEITAWRRLESLLGFDPDKAPEDLIATLFEYIDDYGSSGVEEAAVAVQGADSLQTLRDEISIAKQSRLTCDLRDAVKAAGTLTKVAEVSPWQAAESAATKVRRALGNIEGPLKNTRLAELLNVSREVFRSKESATSKLAYGLRLRNVDQERNVVALRARWSHDRRFELCRALGDAIWSKSDSLGPLTNAKTARQKFQRAFAQSLLCPFSDLSVYMDTNYPADDDVAAAARHFHVAERVIQSVLVNKHVIDRKQFDEMVEAA